MKDYKIGIYEKAVPEEYSLKKNLEYTKEAGYDFLEISIDRTDKRIERLFDKNYIRKLKKDIEETGFSIGSMCLSALGTYTLGNADNSIVNKSMDIFCHALDFCDELGIKIIQIPACDVPKNTSHTKLTDQIYINNLKRIIDMAASRSIIIGLENMEDEYMDSVGKCMRLINNLNSYNFLLYPDSGNETAASKIHSFDIKEDMLLGHNKCCALHLKETKPEKYGGLFYGEGFVDFEYVMDIAWNNLGIRRYVLEYWYTGNKNWMEDLVKARIFFETLINKIGKERGC